MADDILVETKSLRREFGDTVAVNDISLQVGKGAVFALVGPNGAGKTTLMRMLSGLLESTRGTALVGGFDVRESPREVHHLVGYLPDFFGLYDDLTVGEYLEHFARCYRLEESLRAPRIREVLEKVKLADSLDAPLPSLSRGMRQRVAIARTLIHDPPLLLLDEPASGLDPESRHGLQVLFRDLAQDGKTLIVSSHILTELEDYCTHVAILQKGVLAASGKIAEVRASLGKGIRIKIKVSGELKTALRLLKTDKQIHIVEGRENEALLDFAGNEAGQTALLQRLLAADVPVTEFYVEGGGIEETYLALLKKEENP